MKTWGLEEVMIVVMEVRAKVTVDRSDCGSDGGSVGGKKYCFQG